MQYINSLIYSNRTGIRILRHVLFWLVDLVNWLMVISINTQVGMKEVYFFLLHIPFVIIATYFILYYLLPKLSGKDDKGKLFVLIIVVVFLLGVTLRVFKCFVIVPLLDLKPIAVADLWNIGMIIGEVFKWLAAISMAIAIKMIKSKTELEQKNDQLLFEKREAELNFLKLQMHPHFLFNTLNTLYSKTIQNSEQAGQVVMHLSNLLRFMLEECNKPLIALDKEIKVIKDYIVLETLRHGDRLQVNLHAPENNLTVLISPLLFLPFIENSFKHSLNNIRGMVNITIDIHLKDKNLILFVENDFVLDRTKAIEFSSGQGIANIKRQLELLYDKEYLLTIDDTGKKYRISLTIPTTNRFA